MTFARGHPPASGAAGGESLAAVLRREPNGVGSARATHLVVQVLAALVRLHARGLVHGDVRPGNVLVWGAGRNEVARLREPGGERDATRVGGQARRPAPPDAGVLDYRAPEQRTGAGGPAADAWATGVLFHEMLSGRRPPVRPGREFAPSQLDADLPVSIAAALSGALRLDPARRLDCAALFDLLQAAPPPAADVVPCSPSPPPAAGAGTERLRPQAPVGFVKPRPWDSEASTLIALLLLAAAAILAPACLG